MNHNKHILARTALAAALSAPALVTAAPIEVTISGGSWTLDNGWGAACTSAACDDQHKDLNASWSIDPLLAGTSFFLSGVGDFRTVWFGSGTLAEEDGLITASETNGLGLTAMLAFTSPTTASKSDAAIVAATVGPFWDKGHGSANTDLEATFLPALFAFDGGGEIEISFSSTDWICEGNGGQCTWEKPNTKPISVTFRLTKDAVAPQALDEAAALAIPEPSSLLLLGTGLVGLGLGRRKPDDA